MPIRRAKKRVSRVALERTAELTVPGCQFTTKDGKFQTYSQEENWNECPSQTLGGKPRFLPSPLPQHVCPLPPPLLSPWQCPPCALEQESRLFLMELVFLCSSVLWWPVRKFASGHFELLIQASPEQISWSNKALLQFCMVLACAKDTAVQKNSYQWSEEFAVV